MIQLMITDCGLFHVSFLEETDDYINAGVELADLWLNKYTLPGGVFILIYLGLTV